MDRTPTRKQASHERIVAAAGRAIRRAGFGGVGVADIMKEAGLTHGGFYAHFASRDALLVEALERAGRDGAARLAAAAPGVRSAPADWSALRTLVERYLSERHLRAAEAGCAVAALASEMPRQAPDVRAAAAQRVRGLVAAVRRTLPDDAGADAAAAIASQLVGALQLARALGPGAAGKAHLAAAKRSLLAHHDAGAYERG